MSGKTTQVATVEETTLDKVLATGVSKLMVLAPPWLIWPLVAGIGAAAHALWGSKPGQAAAWSAIGFTLGSCLLTLVTWLVSHQRGILGRGSATATTAAVAMWVTACSVAGIGQPVVLWFLLVGGLVACAGWNIRSVIRHKAGMSGVTDPLAFLFDHAKDKAGLGGARMATTAATERKIDAAMALPPGQKTVADVQKKVEYIEGAMGMPPGTMTVAADLDRADRAKVRLSDPRILRAPIDWPGPARPGASIAEPLRPGVWQDGDDVAYVIVGNHLQIMGKTGSGKSLGAGWNLLGEMFTRPDAAVLGADLSKGEQVMGPCRAGLHRFETTKDGVSALIRDVYAQIKPRTDWLAAHGFTAWEPSCGLTYWILWFEEVAKIFAKVSDKDEELFLEIVKEIRSAGGSVVVSLQRADWTQLPTLVRGQLSKMCFGVENSHDAGFGISEAQDDAGARPELWSTRFPGMAYLDAPSVDEARIAMPLRTFLWDKTGAEMRAHSAQFPAAAKTVDEFTAAIARSTTAGPAVTVAERAGQHEDQDNDHDDDEWSAEDALTTEDPDPALHAGVDDPIQDDPDDAEWRFTPPAQKMTPDQARQALLDQLAAWVDEGRQDFSTADLAAVWTTAGMTRQWAQKQMRLFRQMDIVGYDDDEQRHVLLRRPVPA